MKDIFGGIVDGARQNENGHFWVGLDTAHEHCMTCRMGPTKEACQGTPICICDHHLDEHQKKGGIQDDRAPGACRAPQPFGKGEIPNDARLAEDIAEGRRLTPRCTCEGFKRQTP